MAAPWPRFQRLTRAKAIVDRSRQRADHGHEVRDDGPRVRNSRRARLVRRHDRDRFLTRCSRPAERREALLALYAFNYEIAQDARGGARADARPHPPAMVARQHRRDLCTARRCAGTRWSSRSAAAIRAHELDARAFRPPDRRARGGSRRGAAGDLAALEAYAEATSAPLVLLALEALGVRDAASVEAGRAARHRLCARRAAARGAVPCAGAAALSAGRSRLAAAALDVERELFELEAVAGARRDRPREIAERARSGISTAARALRAATCRARALPALLPATLAQRARCARLAKRGLRSVRAASRAARRLAELAPRAGGADAGRY